MTSRSHESSNGVEGFDSCLGHGQSQRPLVHVREGSVVENKLVPGESDDGVLSAGLLDGIGVEDHVLVGHLVQGGSHSARFHGDIGRDVNVFVVGSRKPVRQVGDIPIVVAARNPEERIVLVLDVRRNNDAKNVPPHRTRRVLGGEPLLRRDVDEVASPSDVAERVQRLARNGVVQVLPMIHAVVMIDVLLKAIKSFTVSKKVLAVCIVLGRSRPGNVLGRR